MAGLTKEQRAKREAEKKQVEAARMQVLLDLQAGKLLPEEAARLLNPVNEVREITVTRIVKDDTPTNKVKISGLYSRYPITLYAEHILRLVDEGHWDAAVALAREIVAEGGEQLEVDAPPDDAPPADEVEVPAA